MKKIKTFFKNIFSSRKSTIAFFATILSFFLLIGVTTAWFFSSVRFPVTDIKTGKIDYWAKVYNTDKDGNYIQTSQFQKNKGENNDPQEIPVANVIENWSHNSLTTFYLTIEKAGTLNMDYSLTFIIDGAGKKNMGGYWYRVTKVDNNALDKELLAKCNPNTPETNNYAEVINAYTKNPDYKPALPCKDELCQKLGNNIVHKCTEHDPYSRNMIDMERIPTVGNLTDDTNNNKNFSIIRVDVGLYRSSMSEIYTNTSLTIKANFYVTQYGAISNSKGEGMTHYVESEKQLRSKMEIALPGDVICMRKSFEFTGTLNFNKNISFKTNNYELTVLGDVIYDFLSPLNLKIDVAGENSKIVIKKTNEAHGGSLIFNTPNTPVTITGNAFASNIIVERDLIVNASSAMNSDGFKVTGTNILKSDTPNIVYTDLNVKTPRLDEGTIKSNNSTITINNGVTFNSIIANQSVAKIKVNLAGYVNNINLADMRLIDENPNSPYDTSYPQIEIIDYSPYREDSSTGNPIKFTINLPKEARKFIDYTKEIKPSDYDYNYRGNTRIVREWNAAEFDILANGLTPTSPEFTLNDIEDKNRTDEYVNRMPGDLSDRKLIVYYRNKPNQVEETTIAKLLDEYFVNLNDPNKNYTMVEELQIISIGNKILTEEDLSWIKSNTRVYKLDISDAHLNQNTLNNALNGYLNLKELLLPRNLEVLEKDALLGTGLRTIDLPASVTKIGENAILGIKYVVFNNDHPENIKLVNSAITFKESYIFVDEYNLEKYQTEWRALRTFIYVKGYITDDGENVIRYIIDPYSSNLSGWELVLTTTDSNNIEVGGILTVDNKNYEIFSIGRYALSHIKNQYKLVMNDTVEIIRGGAAADSKVNEIDFGNVLDIEACAFLRCNYLTKLDLKNVTRIRGGVFFGCQNLFEVDLGSVSIIDDYFEAQGSVFGTFEGCSNLTVISARNLTKVGRKAFAGVKNMLALNLYQNVDDKLMNSLYLSEFSLGANSRIYANAQACEALRKKGIPPYRVCEFGYIYGENIVSRQGVGVLYGTTIGTYNLGIYVLKVFSNKEVYILACNKETIETGLWKIQDTFTLTGDQIDYNTNKPYVAGEYKLTRINDYAFYTTRFDAVDLELGANVTTIGYKAFSGEKAAPSQTTKYFNKVFTSIDFQSVKTIEAYAFEYTETLKHITPNNKIETLAEGAFRGCESLLTVNLPLIIEFTTEDQNNDANTFRGCSNLVILDCGTQFRDIDGPNFIAGCTDLHQFILRNPAGIDPMDLKNNFDESLNNLKHLKIYLPEDNIFEFKMTIKAKLLNAFHEIGENYGENYVGSGKEVNIGEYTIIKDYEVLLEGQSAGEGIKGVSICSYNMDTTNIKSDYTLPEVLTIDNIDVNVVRIGTNSFSYGTMPFEKLKLSGKNIDQQIINSGENAIFHNNLVAIGAYALAGSNIRVSNFNNVISIGDKAFDNCNNIYVINAPKLRIIRNFAFSNMANVRYINAPNLESVGHRAMIGLPKCEYIYTNIKNLQKLTVKVPVGGDLVEQELPQITDFYDNTHTLKCITLGLNGKVNFEIVNDKVVTITHLQNKNSLKYCYTHDEIHKFGTQKINVSAENKVIYSYDTPKYLLSKRKAGSGKVVIGENIIRCLISEFTKDFNLHSDIKSGKNTITNIKKINTNAFAGVNFNSNLFIIKNDSSLLEIDDYAFADCHIGGSLLLQKVKTVGKYSFINNNINDVTGNYINKLGIGVFENCIDLTKVQFEAATDLNNPNYNDILMEIPDDAFKGCTKLRQLYLFYHVNVGTNFPVNSLGVDIYFSIAYSNIDMNLELNGWGNYSGITFHVPLNNIPLYKKNSNMANHKVVPYGYTYTAMQGDKEIYKMAFLPKDPNKPEEFELISFTGDVENIVLQNTNYVAKDYKGNEFRGYIISVAKNAFVENSVTKTIKLNRQYRLYYEDAFDSLEALQSITVDSYNSKFEAKDGILYKKLKEDNWVTRGREDVLCYCPRSISATTLTITYEKVLYVLSGAFKNNKTLNSIVCMSKPKPIKVPFTQEIIGYYPSDIIFSERIFVGANLSSITFTITVDLSYLKVPVVMGNDLFSVGSPIIVYAPSTIINDLKQEPAFSDLDIQDITQKP